MKFRRHCFQIVGVMGCVTAGALTAPAQEAIEPNEVRAGDRGICITEVEAGRLVEIPVTVLGLVNATQPEGEMILIRLDDERFSELGIVAGMSGSPVMIGDRLLGALAFGWSFAKEPIGGVTPFSRMQTLARDRSPGDRGAGAVALERPDLVELAVALEEGRLDQTVLDWLLPEREGPVGPLPVTVAAAGPVFPSGGGAWLSEIQRRLGWAAGPAGGGSGDPAPETSPLRPGSMVAAVLVRGDGSLSAGGTVTAIDGRQVWAFGHPFLGGGDVALPMARASVVTMLPTLASSFKIFNSHETIGTVWSDRKHGVWGTLGSGPEMIPIEVRVDGRPYRFEVVNDPVLSPLLAGALVVGSHQARNRSLGRQTVDVDLEMEFDGMAPLALSQAFDGLDASAQAAAWVSAATGYLMGSPFATVPMERMRVEMRATEGLERGAVLDIVPDRWIVEPGSRVGVRVRFQRPGREPETLRMEIDVPDEVEEGRLDLVVADGASWSAYELRARPARSAGFEDEMKLLARLRSSRRMVAALERPGPSVVFPGGTVSAPVGAVASLRSGLGSQLQTASFRVVSLAETTVEGPMSAAARLRLVVKTRP